MWHVAVNQHETGKVCENCCLQNFYINDRQMNLLFICSENRLRSPTGEEVFSNYKNINAIGAGTNNDADTPVSGDLIEWADFVFVMEKSHRNKVSKKFNELLKNKRLICLDIPDNYDRMDPVLVKILKNKVSRYVRLS